MRLSLDVDLCLKQYMHRMKHNETVTEYRLVFKTVYASNEA